MLESNCRYFYCDAVICNPTRFSLFSTSRMMHRRPIKASRYLREQLQWAEFNSLQNGNLNKVRSRLTLVNHIRGSTRSLDPLILTKVRRKTRYFYCRTEWKLIVKKVCVKEIFLFKTLSIIKCDVISNKTRNWQMKLFESTVLLNFLRIIGTNNTSKNCLLRRGSRNVLAQILQNFTYRMQRNCLQYEQVV